MKENDGGSKASYFIAKAMAETKLRNGNYVPPFNDVAGVNFDAKKMKKSSSFIKKHFGDTPIAWKGMIRPPPPTEEETKEAIEESKRRNKALKQLKEKSVESLEEKGVINIPIVRKVLNRIHNKEPYTEKKHLGVLNLLGVEASFVRTSNKKKPFKDVFYSSYKEFKDIYESYDTPKNVVIVPPTPKKEETKEERKKRLHREAQKRYLEKKKKQKD
jgi:hypothetical protein